MKGKLAVLSYAPCIVSLFQFTNSILLLRKRLIVQNEHKRHCFLFCFFFPNKRTPLIKFVCSLRQLDEFRWNFVLVFSAVCPMAANSRTARHTSEATATFRSAIKFLHYHIVNRDDTWTNTFLGTFFFGQTTYLKFSAFSKKLQPPTNFWCRKKTYFVIRFNKISNL